jgi:hypothetical protein
MTQSVEPMNGPIITIQFLEENSVRFNMTFSTLPTEGQIEIAGRELTQLSTILRDLRLNHQLKPQIVGDGQQSPNSPPQPTKIQFGVGS